MKALASTFYPLSPGTCLVTGLVWSAYEKKFTVCVGIVQYEQILLTQKMFNSLCENKEEIMQFCNGLKSSVNISLEGHKVLSCFNEKIVVIKCLQNYSTIRLSAESLINLFNLKPIVFMQLVRLDLIAVVRANNLIQEIISHTLRRLKNDDPYLGKSPELYYFLNFKNNTIMCNELKVMFREEMLALLLGGKTFAALKQHTQPESHHSVHTQTESLHSVNDKSEMEHLDMDCHFLTL